MIARYENTNEQEDAAATGLLETVSSNYRIRSYVGRQRGMRECQEYRKQRPVAPHARQKGAAWYRLG